MSYVIAPKDIRLVREETGRVFRAPKGDMTRGSLHHALDLSAFMISLERAVHARGHVRVLELNEILRAQTRGVEGDRQEGRNLEGRGSLAGQEAGPASCVRPDLQPPR